MNIMKTVADLRKALSVYPDHLPVAVRVATDTGTLDAHLSSDVQIMRIDESLIGGEDRLTLMPVVTDKRYVLVKQ
jgi:hypothetical protein